MIEAEAKNQTVSLKECPPPSEKKVPWRGWQTGKDSCRHFNSSLLHPPQSYPKRSTTWYGETIIKQTKRTNGMEKFNIHNVCHTCKRCPTRWRREGWIYKKIRNFFHTHTDALLLLCVLQSSICVLGTKKILLQKGALSDFVPVRSIISNQTTVPPSALCSIPYRLAIR